MLTQSENTVYNLLKDGRRHTYDALFDALYGGRPDSLWPDSNVIKVFISHLRKKLGVKIESIRGGYHMPEAKTALEQSQGG